MGRTVNAIITLLILTITGCSDDKVCYYSYDHTPIAGWEKNDGVEYDIAPLQATGIYALTLGLRLSDEYPFRNLNMVVQQSLYRNKKKIGTTTNDTITCHVVDRQGSMKGNGVTLYQYDLLLHKSTYHRGDSLHIVVRHNMKREMLPGIADVGIQLKRY